ncbi:MAG: hypothetical protein RL211_1576 [Pseudomonadota bacterium]|jgi:adenine-specific DNA-methyltransferase
MPTLDWLNRASAFTTAARVPYRLLEQVSVHTPAAPTAPAQAALVSAPAGIHDNLLIHGDNLEALKALLPFYRGQVKCIFIDPPYNTQSAFEHYDDNLEHAQWLSMMLPRLQLLRELLREDGSIWVTIDDNEGHYLKVLMDEVFGRGNFVANVVWQKKFAPQNDAKLIDADHDQVLVHSKNKEKSAFNLLPRTDEMNARYKNPDDDPRGPWTSDNPLRREFREYAFYEITTPAGRKVSPPPGSSWRFNKEEVPRLIAENRLWFGIDGRGVPRIKRFLSEVKDGIIAQTVWPQSSVGNTQEAKKEVIALNPADIFDTPKPERLIQRILHIATNEGDLVLDSFLGSGTTAAVAHKMGRRWIGIEMGEHAATHCLPRLQKVIDGEQGGISKAVNWGQTRNGEPFRGGGFRFMRLGPTVFDEAGRIHPAVRFATLAAFVWQQETGAAFDPLAAKPGTPYLGTHYTFDSYSRILDEGSGPISPLKTAQFACYLLFNGILKDKRPASGNVLTLAVLDALLALHATTAEPTTPLLVYGEACRLGEERLKQARVTFKHIPYDVRAQ